MGSTQRALWARTIRREYAPGHRARGLVLLLLLSSLAGLAGTATATPGTDDLAIETGLTPLPDVHYDFNILPFPEVEIHNDLGTSADARQIKAEICEGDRTVQQSCPTGSASALGQVPNNLPGYETVSVRFTTLYFYPDNTGIHTVVFSFPATDIDPSDDKLVYTFIVDNPLRDLIVNDHDVDTDLIYNSGTPIEANLDVAARSWLGLENFTTGWTMHIIEPLAAEAEDCVEWQSNHTGVGDQFGNEVVTHNRTDLDSTSIIHHAPYEMLVTVDNNSDQIFADIDIVGSEFGQDHAVEIIISTDGQASEIYWHNFTGDGMLETVRLFTDFANGTICFTASMFVPDIQIASAFHEVGSYAGTFTSAIIPLPDIVAPYPGNFTVRAGVAGTFSDPNAHNDQISFEIEVDDTVNVWIRHVIPARGTTTYVQQGGQTLVRYPYGDTSIRVVSGNIGRAPVNVTVEVNLYDITTSILAAGPYTCDISLQPDEEARCDFDFPTTGLYRLYATVTPTDGGIDVDLTDNWFEQYIIVDYGAIKPVIGNPTANAVFETGDAILAVADIDPLAPMPLNFTWKLNYMEILGYGQVVNISMPMGNWTITLFVEDENGHLEIATQPVRILNRVEFEQAPHITNGVGVSTQEMEMSFDEPQLPSPGALYPVAYNLGKDPLMMFNLSMVSLNSGEFDIDSLEVWLDLDAFLAPEINLSTVEILRLPDWDATGLDAFPSTDSWEILSDGTLHMQIESDTGGGFMLIGVLDPADVNPANLDIVLRKEGQVTVVWDNEGDVDNPYFGGWRVYRKSVFRFAYPFTSLSQFNSATTGYQVIDLPPTTTSWDDPNHWDQGVCLSYLVMAHSRAGVLDWNHGNVTRGTWNEITERMDVEEVCVDHKSPTTEVVAMRAQVTFDNNSKLHSARISWTWPEIDEEGPLTWNLYRTQLAVSSVNFMEPLQTGLSGEAGEDAWFNETESGLRESIHLEQYYYYVLIPLDEVGNSDYLVRAGNSEGIVVRDQYWSYHFPPPEPAPPPPPDVPYYGPSPWYGRLLDDFGASRFQQAGMVFIAVFLTNLMLVPMMINKYRAKKRKVRREKALRNKRSEMMSTDEFADEFDEFFD
jgi:hypothetical protein